MISPPPGKTPWATRLSSFAAAWIFAAGSAFQAAEQLLGGLLILAAGVVAVGGNLALPAELSGLSGWRRRGEYSRYTNWLVWRPQRDEALLAKAVSVLAWVGLAVGVAAVLFWG